MKVLIQMLVLMLPSFRNFAGAGTDSDWCIIEIVVQISGSQAQQLLSCVIVRKKIIILPSKCMKAASSSA